MTPTPQRADHAGTARQARIAQLRESIARRALTSIGTSADARILQITRTGTVLTVATEQPHEYFPFGVDSFRLPVPDTTDPDFDEDDAPKRWTLVDQYGGFGEDEIERMMADALAYAAELQETAVTA